MDSNTGWVTSENGYILKTVNGGLTWYMQRTPNLVKINKVFFTNQNEGWIIGNKKLFYTSNSGDTWISQELLVTTNIKSIFFVNQANGWIGDNKGRIRKLIEYNFESYCPSNILIINQAPPKPDVKIISYNTSGVVLNATNCNGIYNWSNGQTANEINVTNNGTYTVNCNLNNCTSENSSIIISNLANRVLLSTINSNKCLSTNPLIETSTINQGVNLEWLKNDIPFVNENQSSFIPSEIGKYDVVPFSFGPLGWQWISDLNVQNTIYCAAYINKNIALLAGNFGMVHRTKDGGKTWDVRKFNHNFYDIFFVNETVGFMSGSIGNNNFIYKTVNSGEDWTVHPMNFNSDGINKLNFIDENYGWAVGTRSSLLKTTNGGQNWVLRNYDQNNGEHFNSVFFKDRNNGWIVGQNGGIYYSSDGGVSWVIQKYGNSKGLNDVFFTDLLTGFAVGRDSNLYYTKNGGVTWVKDGNFSTKFLGIDLQKIKFINNQVGYIIGNGYIFQTVDAGLNWNIKTGYYGMPKIGVDFLDEYNGIMSGNGDHLQMTNNAAFSWKINSKLSRTVHKIKYYNSHEGWLISDNKFGVTVDGGKNWSYVNNANFNFNSKAFFLDKLEGWVLNSNVILKTRDGGRTWLPISNNLIASILYVDIHFINQEIGWIVSDANILFYTNNGGQTWTQKIINSTPGSYENYNNLKFFNSQIGILVGNSGIIYKTIDSGNTWFKISQFTTKNLVKIQILNENEAFVSADNQIFKTNDMGLTWETRGTNFSMTDVFFINDQEGWSMVLNGNLSYTTNGGNSWTHIDNISNYQTCFSVIKNNEIIVSGNDNKFLKYGLTRNYFLKSNSINIVDPKTPQIKSFTTFLCSNKPVKLLSNGCNGNVIWNNGNNGLNLTTQNEGIYSAKCEIDGCLSSSSNEILLINSNNCNNPIVDPQTLYLCPNSNNTLTVTGCPNNQVLWSNNSTNTTINISNASSSILEVFCKEGGGSSSVSISELPENLNFNDSFIQGRHVIKSQNKIQYSGKLETNQVELELRSQNSILLNPGFNSNNSIFKAEIGGCLNN